MAKASKRQRPGSPIDADPRQLAEMIEKISRIGADPVAGISRVGYTLPEREAHELVGGWLRDLGLAVETDAVGNTIATRPGKSVETAAIAFGSHLDSVTHGGRFDGIVGVVAMVEAFRLMTANHIDTRHPLRGVIFACEEGARFGESSIGSKAIVGALNEGDLSRIHDADGHTLAEAMLDIGFEPSRLREARWNRADIAAFIEIHIEQGSTLEAQSRSVGLVDVVSGSTRFRMTILGSAGHTGGTPMQNRADALAAAAEVTLAVESIANQPSHRGVRATVGSLDVYPNRITIIPGRVDMSIDVRDLDPDRLRRASTEIVNRATAVCQRRGVTLNAELIADVSPVVLPMWLREVVSQVCNKLGAGYCVMPSGAGHDAQIMARIVPAAIIFVPCRGGASHVPEEWASATDIASGVDVLYHAVLKLDQILSHPPDRHLQGVSCEVGPLPGGNTPADDGPR
jgi:allantoate deiminase